MIAVLMCDKDRIEPVQRFAHGGGPFAKPFVAEPGINEDLGVGRYNKGGVPAAAASQKAEA